MLKIVGLSGSPRHGATEAIIKMGLAEMEKYDGVETSFLTLAGKNIKACTGCGHCRQNFCECMFKDDMPDMIEEFLSADAYLIGSPVYVHSITPQLMAFFSRLRPANNMYPEKFRCKFGAAVSVGGARNGGEESADHIIIDMMLARGLNVVGGESRGYIGGKVWSQDRKELTYEDDPIGIETVLGLSRKLAETALIYQKGKEYLNFDK